MQPFESAILPVVPMKDNVVFPGAILPLFVVRAASLAAVETSLKGDKRLFLALERESDDAARVDVHRVGCAAEVLQVLRMPDGSAKILAEGLYVARAVDFMNDGAQALLVRVETDKLDKRNATAYIRATKGLFETYAENSDKVPEDLLNSIRAIEDPAAFVHAVANYTAIRAVEKQRILEAPTIEEKFHVLNQNLEKENQILEMETELVSQVKSQIGQSQREYFLNEQLKIIERELGMAAEEPSEMEELRAEIEAAGLTPDARQKADKELKRLARMAPYSPEATVARTYIEWMTELPWQARSEDRIDLDAARRILEEDHHGLEKIKERIVEYLAIAKLAGETRGPILCFVGPPGVGKTSLARSIARCIDRKFVRISLGGVRDEAEIRGHRRTYIGAMPGKILQSMKKAATVNPVILLDEIDKLSNDVRGDPSSALLEVLDPEQNAHFNDHYIEADYDLSHVLFIATANSTSGIPGPLLDRMELIRLSGYTDLEKLDIARRFLIPKAIESSGLRKKNVSFGKPAIEALIRGYTRESGVRNLEREIQSVCRKIVTSVVDAQEDGKVLKRQTVTPERIRDFLGPRRFKDTPPAGKMEIGNALGLAWTETGGELLHVEARSMAGKGNLLLTGKLGDVMKESANTALSYIRSHAEELGIDPDFHQKRDIHVHLPEGAIPKDGPSAGITLATALASILSGKAIRQDVAMTGEMTLRGRVLKIGGLKEKALAAYRNRIKYVLVPEENRADLGELPAEVRKKITFIPVSELMEVLRIAFGSKQEGKKQTKPRTTKPTGARRGAS